MNAIELGNLLRKNEDKFIDLGLDSGTLWGGNDLIIIRDRIMLTLDSPFYECIKKFGYQFPTEEQFNELFYLCSCKLYNKAGRDFIIVKSKFNDNFLRFCISKPFLLREPIKNNIPNIINIKSTYFPQIITKTKQKDIKQSNIFFMDFMFYDLIFVKDK